MRDTKRTVLIAGGGIAGLATALCLSKRGFRAEIFEKTASFETVGAGLQISPNAFRILEEIGVTRALKPLATGPTAIRIMSARTAKQIAQVPLGDIASERYGAPYLVVHRADLQGALAGEFAGITADVSLSVAAAPAVWAGAPGDGVADVALLGTSKPLPFGLPHALNRNSGPAAHHFSNVFGINLFFDHGFGTLLFF